MGAAKGTVKLILPPGASLPHVGPSAHPGTVLRVLCLGERQHCWR